MGIRGLTTYCARNEALVSTAVDALTDVTLAVDFVGFLFDTCERLARQLHAQQQALDGAVHRPTTGLSATAWLLLGGCPDRLEQQLESWLQALSRARVKLVFITDPPQCFGGEDHRKSYCQQDRVRRKLEKLREIKRSLFSAEDDDRTEDAEAAAAAAVDGRQQQQNQNQNQNARVRLSRSEQSARLLQDLNSCFPFAREKLRSVLRTHGIEVRTAAREADEELADLVRAQRAFAVLGRDSDFLCMRGTRYIPFNKLVVDSARGVVSARVFTPELVARALGLPVEQLVDLALVCSNDLTPLLDVEFGMATKLNFPVQRVKKGTRAMFPNEAATWIASQIPILANPVLRQIENKTPGLLRALYEVYRFYGYSDAFLRRYPLEIEPKLSPHKVTGYTTLLDVYEFPTSTIDVMETHARTFSNRFDPLQLVGCSIHTLLADARQLIYMAINVPQVREFGSEDELGRDVVLQPHACLNELRAQGLGSSSLSLVDSTLRDLVVSMLYPESPDAQSDAARLIDTLGVSTQEALEVKTVVYALLSFKKNDAVYLHDCSLLNDRQFEILLLTSLICLNSSPSMSFRGGPMFAVPGITVNEDSIEWGVYAAVSVYIETLKKFYELRAVMGGMPPSWSWRCATLFSSEVFLRVCHALSDSHGVQAAWSGTASTSSPPALSEQQVKTVIYPFSAAMSVGVDRFWRKYLETRDTTNALKTKLPAPKIAATQAVPADAVNGDLANQLDQLSINGTTTGAAAARPFGGMMPTSVVKKAKKKSKLKKTPAAVPIQARKKEAASTAQATATQQQAVVSPKKLSKTQALTGLMETLPVFQHRDEILTNVKNNQITIIQGETGCGKSTSVPQFLLDAGLRTPSPERPVNIFVTQPRRIAAIELANTVAAMRAGNEFKETGRVGHVIGYRIGQKQMVSSKTKVTYVTTGYMVERLIHDPDALKTITHLVLDEVHERSMDVDLLLLLLRLQLNDNQHVRLVIMSATMDAQVILKYFANCLTTRLQNKKPLFVGSKLYPVESVFLDGLGQWFPSLMQTCKNEILFMKSRFGPLVDVRERANSEVALNRVSPILDRQLPVIVELIKLLIYSHDRERASQCILVFLPGINAINMLFETLSEVANSVQHEIVSVYVLHSSLELEYQQEAFHTIDQRSTKIILATNIAESSVTIPDVTHVINCGIEKQIDMPNASSSHAEVLIDSWCSQASAKQRSGRAGRVMPGVAFHLFTEGFHDKCMLEYSTPEMLRKPLDRIILLLKGKMADFGTPSELLTKSMDAPDLRNIEGAYKILAHFDAIDSPDEKLAKMTTFGSFVCHLPLNLHLCRLVMTGMYLVQGIPSSVSESTASSTENSTNATVTNGSQEQAKESKGETWPLLLHVVIMAAVLGVPDLFLAPSFYHASSPSKFLKEMSENLKAKIDSDADAWSEPLAIWRMYLEIMVHHTPYKRPNLGALCHQRSISFRRFQTLNFMISDICNRLIALQKNGELSVFSKLFDANTVTMLMWLDAYASSQRLNDYLLNFAVTALAGQTRAEDVLRFLVVHNYDEHLIGGSVQILSTFDDDDLSNMDRVDLRLDSTAVAAFSKMKNKNRVEMFEQLANTSKAKTVNEFAAIAFDGKVVSLYTHVQAGGDASGATTDERKYQDLLPRMSFPISLLYYVRDQRFPVDFGVPGDDGKEDKLRFRVATCNGVEVTWMQQRDNVKVLLSGRSLFSMPIRATEDRELPSQKMLAVYAERMFTGSEAKMVCSKCTLLPPDSVGYYPMLLLLGIRQHTNAWVYVNNLTSEIVTVKVDGQVAVLPPKVGIRLDIVNRINVVRRALSDALQGAADGKRVNVADLLALVDDSSYVVKGTKATNPTFEWRQLRVLELDKAALKEMVERGVTAPRFPPLLV